MTALRRALLLSHAMAAAAAAAGTAVAAQTTAPREHAPLDYAQAPAGHPQRFGNNRKCETREVKKKRAKLAAVSQRKNRK